MTDDKFILMNMGDERAADIAEVLKNKTCKKILEFLAETKEASEQDIAKALGIPLNTVEYNINKLVKSGLVEKAKNFFWSVKGRKIEMFKLAKKHIIISPIQKRPNMNALRTILPAVLIALAFVVLIFVVFPEIEEKFGGTNISIVKPTIESQLKHFSSYDELKDFVKESSETRGYLLDKEMMVTKAAAAPAVATAVAEGGGGAGAEDFSKTNIQVEGVDEADIVKNDRKYIYAVTGNKVAIVEAYPAENMKILSEININGVNEIFINKDKLIVFAEGYEYVQYSETKCLAEYGDYKGGCGGSSTYKSLIYIYDIEDREKPVLEQNISVEGNYIDSRMIGSYVYAISTKYVNIENPESPVYVMNGVEKKVAVGEIYYWPYPDTSYTFTSIMAVNVEDGDFNSEVFLTGATGTIYVSQNNIYLTREKRISSKEYNEKLVNEVYLAVLPDSEKEKVEKIMASDKSVYEKQGEVNELIQDYSESLAGNEKAEFDKKLMKAFEDFEIKIQKENEKTIVNKINVDKKKIEYKGAGEVPGHILNQFSMDEYEGNFRIATTTGEVWEGTSLNHLYILDENLKIVGKVEDLAHGEKIYSARFLGKRAYIVTFKKVDPLFVIDVSIPEEPKVLGYLKITGYSDYLHPYDENHIIGIGKEAVAASEEETSSRGLNFAWYQGLKISLFDVSDVVNPIEKAKIVIGDRGTDSNALYEHKAFLFDKKRNLLVIPISLAEINESKYRICSEEESNSYDSYNYCLTPYTYGEQVWEGAYVLNINLDEISIRGKITHVDEYKPKYGPAKDDSIGTVREISGANWTKIKENGWKAEWMIQNDYSYDYYGYTDDYINRMEGGINYNGYLYAYGYEIQRSLYMDDVLYTISNSRIKANNLDTVEEISKIDLPYEQEHYPYPLYG